MPELFNIILVSMSRLLFSSPAFVELAESSFSGARRVQDREVRIATFGVVPVLTSRRLTGSSI